MATGDLPQQVRSFIARHVESVLDLDILLAIRASDGTRDAAALARELRLNEAACAAALEKFASNGLVARCDGGYRYQPSAPQLAESADALAAAYARRRVSVIRFVYKRPGQGARGAPSASQQPQPHRRPLT